MLGTQRLLEHAGRAGVRHFLYISIVGVDQIPFGYYRAKLQGERLIQRQTAVNWSILRATQFHDVVNLYFRTLRWLPALLMPKATPCQPVDAGEVADRLCALVLGGPAGRTGGADRWGVCPTSVGRRCSAPTSWLEPGWRQPIRGVQLLGCHSRGASPQASELDSTPRPSTAIGR